MKKKIKKIIKTAKRYVEIFIVGLLFVIAGVFLILGAFNLIFANRVYPNIYLGKTPLGGLTKEELSAEIETQIKTAESRPLIFSIDNQGIQIKPGEIDLKYDALASEQKIFGFGRNTKIQLAFWEQIQLVARPKRFSAVYKLNEEKLNERLDQLIKANVIGMKDAGLKFNAGQIIQAPEEAGKKIDSQLLKATVEQKIAYLDRSPFVLKTEVANPNVYQEGLGLAKKETAVLIKTPLVLTADNFTQTVSPEEIFDWLYFYATANRVVDGRGLILGVSINEEKIKEYLKKIAVKIDQPAANAKLAIKDGKAIIFQPARDGREVDIKATTTSIIKALEKEGERRAEIIVKKTEAEIKDETIDRLGIKELIGTAETSFAKSPANRISNLENGAKYLNGLLIKPGEELSAVKALGSISAENGYLPELVIKENRTIPEIGGGLCQVSTTLFRAALNAGLPIIERTNHSFRVSYYEPPIGLDATIYIPQPDLKFKNDTPGWILVQSSVNRETKKIKFDFYGTADGRRTEIKGPYASNYVDPPEPIYEDDFDLPEGETKQIEKAHQGASSVAYYKVYNADNSVRTDQVFRSKYKALPAVYRVGKKPAEQPTQ